MYLLNFPSALPFASYWLPLVRIHYHLTLNGNFSQGSFHAIDIKQLFQSNRLLYYIKECPFTEYNNRTPIVNNINISNMATVSLLQVKKWRWGRLPQISRGKLSHCSWLLSMRAFSWIIGPDIGSPLSLAC